MIIRKSFAKINLYLEIIGKRPDGYHLLDSLMAFLNIYDLIKIRKNNQSLNLFIDGPYSDSLNQNPSSNLIIKAVNLFVAQYNIEPKIDIFLTKNIPIGAGLGGGSANAATILHMLFELFIANGSQKYTQNEKEVRKKEDLEEIALKIGCDVPFCMQNDLCFVGGVGEKIKKANLDLVDLFAVIVNPNLFLSTKKVFDLFDGDFSRQTGRYQQDLIKEVLSKNNSLQACAIKIFPEIAGIIDLISEQKNCLVARMSGSGSTCFGLFKNRQDAHLAFLNLTKSFPKYYIKESLIIYQTTPLL